MSIEQLFFDYNIPIAGHDSGNYREGWINIKCPFCADHSQHLGINISNSYANCWRCGWHPIDAVVSEVLGIKKSKAYQILKNYTDRPVPKKKEIVPVKIRIKAHKLPTDCGPLKKQHKIYLEKRDFDPEQLAETWNLLGTGPISKLDEASYKHRILAPIIWNDQQVSFQARDITNKQNAKYKACPKDRELIEHQTILYGNQTHWSDIGICVEGITDVWRFGPKAFATFGIDYTHKQLRIINKNFKRIFIAFDPEKQAQKQAQKLKKELMFRGTECVLINLKSDPGDLSKKQINHILRKIY